MNRRTFVASSLAVAAASGMPRVARAKSLEGIVRRIVASGDATFGVFARTMAGGSALLAVDAHESFPCASTIKVLVMTTAFYEAERKPEVLRERIRFDRSSMIGGSDYMSGVSDGARMTVAQLMVPMILVSDNTAANMLIEHFGVRRINAVGRRAGMLQTRLVRPFVDASHDVRNLNVTTPYDMATLLYRIERGAREGEASIVSPEHCRRMIRLMLAQRDRDKIPAGLPHGTACADKDGEVDGTRNDAAIVEPFGDSPFILSIYSKNVGNYDGCLDAIRRIARATYATVRGSDA